MQKFLTQLNEESLVIIHCTYTGSYISDRIRIWKTTFLCPKDSETRSQLVHVENISLYPKWTTVPIGKPTIFTLVFTGLPKQCKMFDLLEIIPEPAGFMIRNIPRNNTDVYNIRFF